MHLFYTPDIAGDQYTLSEEESKHCIRVLRLKNGDQVELIDGRGGFYKAEITDDNPRACSVQVIEKQEEYGRRDFHLHIAIAPTKNMDRLEWFIEKAVEIGVDEITPIICDRSERRELKGARLEKIVTSAVKQSVKAYYPKLNEAMRYADFIKKSDFKGQKMIAHCDEGDKRLLKDTYKPGSDVLIVIGPEGDFSKGEIEKAISAGYAPVSLGKARLRTETAGIYVCAAVNILNEK